MQQLPNPTSPDVRVKKNFKVLSPNDIVLPTNDMVELNCLTLPPSSSTLLVPSSELVIKQDFLKLRQANRTNGIPSNSGYTHIHPIQMQQSIDGERNSFHNTQDQITLPNLKVVVTSNNQSQSQMNKGKIRDSLIEQKHEVQKRHSVQISNKPAVATANLLLSPIVDTERTLLPHQINGKSFGGKANQKLMQLLIQKNQIKIKQQNPLEIQLNKIGPSAGATGMSSISPPKKEKLSIKDIKFNFI
ncbi:hypothetical protein FGO68_gene13505 [Halteria grandinella]|uniref:Uncharacterized protein n=1 Tax=Halteria grandinella TaxID=5974 RepID=A0A8J8P131_HALGN|nr:hypothetical protein FGO68_gene13505 [Halteria grandinella]